MAIMNSGHFQWQYPSTIYEPQSSLPWYVGKTIDTKDVTTIGGRSHELITNAADNCEVIGTERRADGREYPVLLGTMESPELARFVVNAANTFHRNNSTTELTPQELLKATETAIDSAELDKVSKEEIKETLAAVRSRERIILEQFRLARESAQSLSNQAVDLQARLRESRQVEREAVARASSFQNEAAHLRMRIEELEKEKEARQARDSGVIKTMSNGRKMRFKERSDDQQN